MKRIDFKKEAKNVVFTILGAMVIAVGIAFFINPVKLYTGGVTGLAQLLVNLLERVGVSGGWINLGLLVFLFQIPFMVLGFIKLSKKFIAYTILTVVLVSFFLSLGIGFPIMGEDMLTSALAGGIMTGIGNGILYSVGSSSGGTAILFQVLSIKTGKSTGFFQIILHGMIILIAGWQFGIDIAVYTIVSQLISALVVDKIHTGYNTVKLEIVTDLGEEMRLALAQRLPHGITIVDGIGGYSNQAKKILYTIISYHELPIYLQTIETIDPKAFIAILGVSKVKGNFKKSIIE